MEELAHRKENWLLLEFRKLKKKELHNKRNTVIDIFFVKTKGKTTPLRARFAQLPFFFTIYNMVLVVCNYSNLLSLDSQKSYSTK